MALIKKIHHIAMKAEHEDFVRAVDFYTNVLGLEILRRWPTGCMIKVGESVLEFTDGVNPITGVLGTLQHLALATDDLDACVKTVTEAGYEVFTGPKEVIIKSEPPYPIRCAFIHGPLGEEIEFFQEL